MGRAGRPGAVFIAAPGFTLNVFYGLLNYSLKFIAGGQVLQISRSSATVQKKYYGYFLENHHALTRPLEPRSLTQLALAMPSMPTIVLRSSLHLSGL